MVVADCWGGLVLGGAAWWRMAALCLASTAMWGLVRSRLFGLWWDDPLAALLLVWWIRGEAKEAVEAGRA